MLMMRVAPEADFAGISCELLHVIVLMSLSLVERGVRPQ